MTAPETPRAPAQAGAVAAKAHTPGPWRWEVNLTHKSVKLCGGPSEKGFGKYDLTVLDFSRWGLNSAAPVFWDWNLDWFVGETNRADKLAKPVPGREHHAGWFADIDHPDARLIAAAPDLLSALQYAMDQYGKPGGPWNVPSDPGGWLDRARNAVAKALGVPSMEAAREALTKEEPLP